MASPSKRLSRKELRQPDWFQTHIEDALEFYQAHRFKAFLAIAAIILLLLGFWVWGAFKERQNSMAAQEFGQAMTQYHAEKYREAIAALEKVQTHRWSKYASLAHLYEANSYLALNELPKAANAAQRFIVATDQSSLMRQIGLLTLADIDERQSRCNEAIKHYRDAASIQGPFVDQAHLGTARCAVEMGDLDAGIAAYRQVLKTQSGSPSANYIVYRIAELETKLSSQPAK